MSSDSPHTEGNALQDQESSSSVSVESENESHHPASSPEDKTVTATPELASLLECPICYCTMLSNIWQCDNGHLMCENCRWEMRSCHSCRAPLEYIRNLGLENLAKTLAFPIELSPRSSTVSLRHDNEETHEKTPKQKSLICPIGENGCMWEGPLAYVVPHIRKAHGNIPSLQRDAFQYVTDIVHFEDEENVLISCFGQHFVLILQRNEYAYGLRMFSAVVQVIASEELEGKFIYKLDLSNKGQHMQFEAPVTTINHLVSPWRRTPFLMIGHGSVMQFTENGKLAVKVMISKV